jgi:hypothetical protein
MTPAPPAVSDTTRQYWLDVVLGWAGMRLMPPQFAECKRALTADPLAAALAACRAERDALRAALAEFGGHSFFCTKDVPFSDGQCSCGWDAAAALTARPADAAEGSGT